VVSLLCTKPMLILRETCNYKVISGIFILKLTWVDNLEARDMSRLPLSPSKIGTNTIISLICTNTSHSYGIN
jgi:hypothetical protein